MHFQTGYNTNSSGRPHFVSTQLKGKLKLYSILLVLICTTTLCTIPRGSAQVGVSFEIFYENLSPYGSWVDHPNYGYVWAPRVSYGFRPYGTQGRWVFTNSGWTWVSDYPWGWAPFHYGRWFRDRYWGWLWVPDYQWGPAWVTWRRSEGYYGWAPLRPGISLEIAYGRGYDIPEEEWRFVRDRDFGRSNMDNLYVAISNYSGIIRNSQPIQNMQVDHQRNVRYNAGPDRIEVEKRMGRPFNPLPIIESNRPAQNLRKEQLEIYRPQIEKMVTDRKLAPSKIVTYQRVQQNQRQPPKKVKGNPFRHDAP